MPTPLPARRSPLVPRRRPYAGPARVAVALSSLALLGALPTAAHAAGWVDGPRFAVAAGSIGGDFVEAPDGSSTLSWFSGRDDLLPVIQVQHAREDGTVTAPLTLGSGVSPALATSTADATAVGWIGRNPWDDDRTVRVTLLDADGAIVRTTTVATLSADEAGGSPSVDVALDAAGRATVVWTRIDPDSGTVAVEAAVVSPRGIASEPVTLGETAEALVSPPTVAAAPDGPAWAGWITPDSSVEVARLNDGGGIDVPATRVSEDDDRASAFRLSASAAGAAIAWVVPDPDGDTDPSGFPLARFAGVRLAASGSLVGAAFGVGGAIDVSSGGAPGFGSGVGLAVGPDGSVSLGWTRAESGARGLTATISRFAPGQATATATPLSRSNGLGSLAPRLGAAADGSLLASWLRLDGLEAASVAGARIAPDGTIETAPTTVTSAPFDGGFLPPQLLPQADDHGAGIIGVGTSFPGGAVGWGFSAFRLDVVGPTVTVDGPSTAVVQAPVRFVGTVADPAKAPLSWDFGDGTTANGRRADHVYATPGTYTVTARATDEVANETVVTHEIAVTAAPAGGPSTGPGGGATPPAAAPPSSPTAAAPALKIAKATRDGAKVTVNGTINARATGRLTVSYAQRVGRSTVSVKRTASVTKGRWRTTLTLPRALTKGRAAKRRGTVTASFAGTTAVKRATAKRTVSLAKAKKPATPKH